MTTIPAGYRITVRSWENDGDYNSTKTVDGLTYEQAGFYCTILSHFGSGSNGEAGQFGNMYEPSDAETAAFGAFFRPILLEHESVFRSIVAETEEEWQDVLNGTDADFAYHITEILYDFTGDGDFFTRVVSSVKVEHLKQEVRLNDVSADFPQPPC